MHQWEQGANAEFVQLLGVATFKVASKGRVHPERQSRVRFAQHDSYCDGDLDGSSETQPSSFPALRALPRNGARVAIWEDPADARVAIWEDLPLACKALSAEPTLLYTSEVTQASVEQPLH